MADGPPWRTQCALGCLIKRLGGTRVSPSDYAMQNILIFLLTLVAKLPISSQYLPNCGISPW